MKSFGDLEQLKKIIEEKYSQEFDEIAKTTKEYTTEIEKEYKVRLEKEQEKIMSETVAEAERVKVKTLIEKKLEAKHQFETVRETYLQGVLESVRKKAINMFHSSHYIKFVKSALPKDLKSYTALGDDTFYKKHLKLKNFVVDKSVIGVKIIAPPVVYDYTLETLLQAKNEKMRELINKILFEQK